MDVSTERGLISKAVVTDSRMILREKLRLKNRKNTHNELDLKHKCISLYVSTI